MPIACRRWNRQGGQGDDFLKVGWYGWARERMGDGRPSSSPQHALEELTRPPCRGTIA